MAAPVPAAPPYVSWSSSTAASVPAAVWPSVFAALQALKGHVQEYPGCQRLEVFVQTEPDGQVRIHCYTTWDAPEQLDAYVERGYTFARMLDDVAGIAAAPTRLMEKLF